MKKQDCQDWTEQWSLTLMKELDARIVKDWSAGKWKYGKRRQDVDRKGTNRARWTWY